VTLQENRNYSDDILDIITHFRSHTFTADLWEAAISHDENNLSSVTDDHMSDYVLIRQNLPEFEGRLRGEYGRFDHTKVSIYEYQFAKLAQRIAVTTTSHRGYGFLSKALSSVADRHGIEVGISFLKKAWYDRFIVLPTQFHEFMWVFVRCQAFDIDFETSYAEYREAISKTGAKDLVKNLAKINSEKGRQHQNLLIFYDNLKSEAEADLLQAKLSPDISQWIRSIQNLFPMYLAIQRIADEACATTNDDVAKNEIDSLARFADERKADIGTILTLPTPVPYLNKIADVLPNRINAKRQAKYYYRARITFPQFVFEKIIDSIEDGDFDASILRRYFEKQLSPGHKLAYKKSKERLGGIFLK
jgi:hypothetical protein